MAPSCRGPRGRRSRWNSVRAADPIQRRRRGINRSRNYNEWPYIGNLWQLNHRPRHARPRDFRQSRCPQKRWIGTICRNDLLRPTGLRNCRPIGLWHVASWCLRGVQCGHYAGNDRHDPRTATVQRLRTRPPGQFRHGRKIDAISRYLRLEH